MKRCDTVMENIITWFKYLYIFHIICAGNSLLFDTPLLKVTSVLVLILGVVAVFYLFSNQINTIAQIEMSSILLFSYCLSHHI